MYVTSLPIHDTYGNFERKKGEIREKTNNSLRKWRATIMWTLLDRLELVRFTSKTLTKYRGLLEEIDFHSMYTDNSSFIDATMIGTRQEP
eukprot:scaffold38298_cov49-Attheya_sp.AAC.10